MLPKKNRADTKEVEKIFKDGRFLNSSNLTFKFILTKDSPISRISVVVPKTVSKKAVERNKLRRLGYFALQKHIDNSTSLLGVFVFKKYQDDISTIENEIQSILNKVN